MIFLRAQAESPCDTMEWTGSTGSEGVNLEELLVLRIDLRSGLCSRGGSRGSVRLAVAALPCDSWRHRDCSSLHRGFLPGSSPHVGSAGPEGLRVEDKTDGGVRARRAGLL